MIEEYKNENGMDTSKMIRKVSDKEYWVYIVGDIYEDFTKYIELHQLFSKSDVLINIFIKTLGGDMHSGLALYEIIKSSKAETVAHVHTARSAGGMIMLACDRVVLNEFSSVMIHEPQYNYNKNNLSQNEVYTEYIRKVWEKSIEKIFIKFDPEIVNKITRFKEVFYVYDEIKERL